MFPPRWQCQMPTAVVPSDKVTVSPASASPVKVGVTMLVMSSVLDTPVSDAAARASAVGAEEEAVVVSCPPATHGPNQHSWASRCRCQGP